MPIFAMLLMGIANGLVLLLGRVLVIEAAIKLAAYLAWLALTAALIGSVYLCLSSLLGLASGLFNGGNGAGGWVHMFFVGLGMFIPSNAGAVMSCVSSVWLGTNIYRVQSFAVKSFHGGGALTV